MGETLGSSLLLLLAPPGCPLFLMARPGSSLALPYLRELHRINIHESILA